MLKLLWLCFRGLSDIQTQSRGLSATAELLDDAKLCWCLDDL